MAQLKYKVQVYIDEGFVQPARFYIPTPVKKHPEESLFFGIPFGYDGIFASTFGGPTSVVWDGFAVEPVEMVVGSITIQTQADPEDDGGHASTDGMITEEEEMEEDWFLAKDDLNKKNKTLGSVQATQISAKQQAGLKVFQRLNKCLAVHMV